MFFFWLQLLIQFSCSVTDAVYRRKLIILNQLLHSGNVVCTVLVDIINREPANVVSNFTSNFVTI